jgi:hypothetical protein
LSHEERYRSAAFSLGIQYYGAGRFAVAAGFQPVGGNLLHHAVELFLKGCLASVEGVDALRKYGHNLEQLWGGFKTAFSNAPVAGFDSLIHELHRFEWIRYPETALREGSSISVEFEIPTTPTTQLSGGRLPAYHLTVADVDRLICELWKASKMNPQAFVTYFKQQHAEKYFLFRNETPLVS